MHVCFSRLSGCYLTSECCEEISTVFTCNNNLKTLKLGNNNIQDSGVSYVKLCVILTVNCNVLGEFLLSCLGGSQLDKEMLDG